MGLPLDTEGGCRMRSTECDDSCDGLVVGEELSASGTLQVSTASTPGSTGP